MCETRREGGSTGSDWVKRGIKRCRDVRRRKREGEMDIRGEGISGVRSRPNSVNGHGTGV